jgi:hypothetical protein
MGLGALNKVQGQTITMAITGSGGDWTAYAIDSTVNNAGIADLDMDVIGSGGTTVTSSFENLPQGSTTIKKVVFTTGFNTNDSGGTNGLAITAGQPTTYSGANNATSDSLVYQGIGQTTGSKDTSVWTQTALGIEVASGTYVGAGTLTVSMVVVGSTPQDAVLNSPWAGPGNLQQVPFIAGSVVVGGGVSAHPIISLTTVAPASNYGTQILNGTGAQNGSFSTGTNKLTVSGNHGNYLFAQVTGISGGSGTATGYVEANGFSPATDEEVYALEVVGSEVSGANLATLAADINSANSYGSGETIAFTSFANDPFPAAYNLFLEFPTADLPVGTTGDNFLGVDLSQDPNITGDTIAAIAVVPEPMSLGLLALGGVGMLVRRRRSSQA